MSQAAAVDAVITALISTLDAALTIPVHDGLEVTDDPDRAFVIVGNDGDPSGAQDEAGASLTQDWATFEAGSRDENGQVKIALVVWTGGGGDLSTLRATSKTHLAAIETALRATENLGGVVAAGGITAIDLHQDRTDKGVEVRRVLTYSYTAYQS